MSFTRIYITRMIIVFSLKSTVISDKQLFFIFPKKSFNYNNIFQKVISFSVINTIFLRCAVLDIPK